ncbi:MAG: hypothetical protein RXN90_08730 [Thermoproteus sp.]
MERRREIYFLDEVPQVGTRYYGIVDQGTNVVEVRPTSLCPLNFPTIALRQLSRL